MFVQDDETRDGTEALARELSERGVEVFVAGVSDARAGSLLPTVASHAVLEPILVVQSFYRFANALAIARGHDPDDPPHLRKVTETL